MNEQYLNILLDSLVKKNDLLDEIQRLCKEQSEVLAAEPVDFDQFDSCMDNKDVCIEQLNTLDEGFETLYERIRDELQEHREEHTEWISKVQKLIAEITEKSVAIQAQEERNKKAVEAAIQKERKAYNIGKRSVQVATQYYKNMSNTNVVPAQYMDKKK